MNPEDFIKTIYLGDRGCKSIHIKGWDKQVAIEVNEISRIRDASGLWNYYNEENIVDGLIVFTGVKEITFSPPGLIPNDFINNLEVTETKEGFYTFMLSIDSVDETPYQHEVFIEIKATGIHLEDPTKPGEKITD